MKDPVAGPAAAATGEAGAAPTAGDSGRSAAADADGGHPVYVGNHRGLASLVGHR